MAPQLAPGIAEVAVQQTLNGEQVYNVLNFTNGTGAPWNAPDLATLAGEVFGAFEDSLPGILSVGWTLNNAVATDIGQEGGAQAVYVPGSPVPGELTGQTLPNQVALVVTLRTARVGRSYRGRTFLCGFPEESSEGSFVAVGSRAALNAARDAWENALLAIRTGTWCVLSRRLNKAPRPFGIGTPITAAQLRNYRWDTMTTRLPGS